MQSESTGARWTVQPAMTTKFGRAARGDDNLRQGDNHDSRISLNSAPRLEQPFGNV